MKIIPFAPSLKTMVGLSYDNDWSSPIPDMAVAERNVIIDDHIWTAYRRLADVQPPPTGCVVVNDAIVVGGSGVVVDPKNGVTYSCWQELGWTGDQLRIAIQNLGGAYDPAELDIPDAQLQADETVIPEATLLAWPGINTFGHWIVDVPARLAVADRCGYGGIRTAIVGQPQHMVWQSALLERFGAADMRLVSADRRALLVKRLIIPSLIRNNDYIGRVLYQDIFPLPAPRAAKAIPLLLLKHTPITSKRPRVANMVRVEDAVLAQGGRVTDPLQMPLPEQLRLLATAEVIIGEDSSALHNAALLADAPDLIVLSAGRTNLLHAGLQSLRDRMVGYIDAAAGTVEVTVDAIADVLTRMRERRGDIASSRQPASE